MIQNLVVAVWAMSLVIIAIFAREDRKRKHNKPLYEKIRNNGRSIKRVQ